MVAMVPGAIDACNGAGAGREVEALAVHLDFGPVAPGGYAQVEAEGGRLLAVTRHAEGESDGFVEGIVGGLVDVQGHSVGYADVGRGGGVDEGGCAVVGGGVEEVLQQFGPSLVHVGGAAGVAGQFAEEHVGVVVRGGEVAPLAGDAYLVGLLEVLTGIIAVGGLRGQCVVGYALQPVGPGGLPGDLQDGFERVHHFDGGA